MISYNRRQERKEAEEELERYKLIVESLPDGVFTFDLKGNVTSVNNIVLRYGYKKEEIVGKNLLEFIPEKYWPMISKHLTDLAKGKSTQGELELKTKQGTLIAEFRSSPIKKGGKIIGFQSIVRDITDRKKAEEELIRLSSAVKTSTDSILISDIDAKIIDVNEGTLKMYGADDKKDLIGKNAFDLIAPEDREKAFTCMEKVLEKGYTKSREYHIITKDGSRMPVEMSTVIMKDVDDKPIGFVTISRDITERKAMEKKLEEYAERLEEMVEQRTRELKESQKRLIQAERLAAIGELATMVGHDLRNPLSSIQNACYYLKMKLEDSKDEKLRKMFEVVTREINYANKIINDLLDFSRVKKPEFKKVDIISSIQDALAQLEFPENIKITTKFSEVPAIEADPDHLRRIFQNIALNGIQAMPNGGELTVSVRKNSDFVEVAFTDTGVGIPEENMDKLFTPLFTTKAQGVGLGLAICKNLVEAHNGRIEVKSKVGEGTTFTVKLPIHQTKGGEKRE